MNLLSATLGAACAVTIALSGVQRAHAQQAVQRLTQHGHTTWQVQDGLISSPNGIAQTKDGYLWLATDGGLMRFDGVRFVARDVLPKGSTTRREATAVLAATDGSLWIALPGRLVQLKDGKSVVHVVPGIVQRLAEDDSGAVWTVQTRTTFRGALCRVANGQVDCPTPAELPLTGATGLSIDKGGGVWVGASNTLCQWSQTRLARCHLQDVLKPQAGLTGVQAILEGRDGTLWVGIGKAGRGLGLGQFTDGRWKPFAVAGLDGSTLAVSSLMQDRDGALWVGTLDQGVWRIHGGHAEHFGRADGLTSDTVAAGGLFQDREGTVWVLTASGLDAFRPLPVSVFSVREGLPADSVESVLATRDGTVWFGNQTLSILSNNEPAPPPHPELFRGKEVTSMLEDHAGRLWIGLDNTFNVFEGGVLKPISAPGGGAFGAVERIIEDTAHNVWIVPVGLPKRLLRIRDGGAVERVDGTGPIPQGLDAFALAPNPKGGILLGLRDGAIASFREGKLEMSAADSSSNSTANSLYAAADGTILATTGKGLMVQRGTSRHLLNVERGLPCERLRAVVRDRRDGVWLKGDCGILFMAAAELERWLANPNSRIDVRLFDVTDGVRPGFAAFMPEASVGADGRVWFANSKVAQVIDPAAIATRRPAPEVRVEEITADRSVFGSADVVKLPPRTRDLEIRYTALTFIAPQKVKFRYRLEGRDEAWTEAGTRRAAFYTDLPPGNYRFRVIACNAEGVWSDTGASQNFEIAPLFYQTAWFIALCSAGAALALYGFYVLRLRQVAARVSDRIAAKNAERERIARELHDTLLQSTEGLILQFQAASSCIPKGDPARESLENALDRAGEVVAEGRDRVQDLRTSDSAFGDLARSLAAVGEELARGSGAGFSTIVEGMARELKATVLDEAYRIGREALLNANRHAAANKIEVQIIYSERHFRLRIRDDGIGIDTSASDKGLRPGHWGLPGMRERAQKIGARLNVWSRPGAGTEIELRIPAALAYEKRASPFGWLSGLRLAGE